MHHDNSQFSVYRKTYEYHVLWNIPLGFVLLCFVVVESSVLRAMSFKVLIARFMGPIWGPYGAGRTQVGPMLAPWTLLSVALSIPEHSYHTVGDVTLKGVGNINWLQTKPHNKKSTNRVILRIYYTHLMNGSVYALITAPLGVETTSWRFFAPT